MVAKQSFHLFVIIRSIRNNKTISFVGFHYYTKLVLLQRFYCFLLRFSDVAVVRVESLVTSGKSATAASISQTICLTGIIARVGANFGPFPRRERSV